MKRTWTRTPERGSTRAMRIGVAFLNLFGYWMGLVLAFMGAFYFFVSGRISRDASLGYLRRLRRFDPRVRVDVNWRGGFRHHLELAINLVDRIWFWQGKLKRFTFTSQGREHLLERKGPGAVLIGAHIGSFDAMRAFSHRIAPTINAVMFRGNAQKINGLFGELEGSANFRVVEMEEGDLGRIFDLKERIDRGEFVAILGDRLPPHGRERWTLTPFLGESAGFPQNPWILASLLECPVFLVVCVRVGMCRYHVQVKPLTERVMMPRKTRDAALSGYVRQYVAELERICVSYPYQWFNFYDFWNPVPPNNSQASDP